MTTGEGYTSPQERYVVRGVQRWAMILTAAGLLDDDENAQADYLKRPWLVRGFKPVHKLWVARGKPRPPGEEGHNPRAWSAFVDEAHQVRGMPR